VANLAKAEMHRLEAGHFAVEDCLDYISEHMRRFYEEPVQAKARADISYPSSCLAPD
jgi:hypothetical protein